MKTFEECCNEVAKKHKLGTTLVTGHRKSYYEEACKLYAKSTIEFSLIQAAKKAKARRIIVFNNIPINNVEVIPESILDLRNNILKTLEL